MHGALDAGARAAVTGASAQPPEMDINDKYLVLLRRELTRALAQLRRAERERDRALAENVRLRGRKANPRPKRARRSPPR